MLSAARGRAEREYPMAFSIQLSAISKKEFLGTPLLYPPIERKNKSIFASRLLTAES